VICTAGAAATVRVNGFVAVSGVGAVESVIFTVKLKEPAAVGVPEMAPDDADSVRPTGKAPELTLQVYGVVPPVASNVVEYAVAVWPDGTELVVICTAGAAATVRVNDFVVVSAVGTVESVTFTVKLKEAAAVGVPEIVPVAADIVSPAGSAPELMLQLYGAVPPVAATVVEYTTATCPAGKDVVVICTGVTAAVTVVLKTFVAVCGVGIVESVTIAVKLNVPDIDGVPEI